MIDMAQLESIGAPPAKDTPEASPEEPRRVGRPRGKPRRRTPPQPQANEMRTPEEWEEVLAREREEAKRAEEARKQAAQLLTKEQWIAQYKAEQEAAARKTMTREEFLASLQDRPAAPPPTQRKGAFSRGLIGRLAENANSALGVVSEEEARAAREAAHGRPAGQPAQSIAQQVRQQYQPTSVQPAPALEEITGAAEARGPGMFGMLKENAVLAGAIAMIGLLLLYLGMGLAAITGLVTDLIGLALLIIGGIPMVLVHMPKMIHG